MTIEKCMFILRTLAFDRKLVISATDVCQFLTGFCPVSCCYHEPCVVTWVHALVVEYNVRVVLALFFLAALGKLL